MVQRNDHRAFLALLLVALLGIGVTHSSEISILITSPNITSPIQAGSSIFVQYRVACTGTPDTNFTKTNLFPYINGTQWGSELILLQLINNASAGGEAWFPLPPTWSGTIELVVQASSYPTGPTVGNPINLDDGAISNALLFTVTPRAPKRRLPSNGTHIGMYIENWFTPYNMFWQGGVGTAEVIPLVGRYSSFSLDIIRQQAFWFIQADVDFVGIDWTNNLWNIPSWDQRPRYAQEIINATQLCMGVFASLKRNEGWDVPRFMIILGLDNGPIAPVPAVMEELDFIVSAMLANASVGPDMFVSYLGKPLVTIFDGTGADHSNFTHPNFTIRWMASQDQSDGLNTKGYWSWMDASLTPPLTMYNGQPEAATITPAYFADNGWLNSAHTMGHSGGLTYIQQVSALLQETVGQKFDPITFLFICQWNEYAGQLNGQGYGPQHNIFVDSYSADLSNDLEPASPYACAYPRPGTACGGSGYRSLNLAVMMNDAVREPSLLDGSVVISVLQPSIGEYSNYTDASQSFIEVSWQLTTFNSSALRSGRAFAYNTSAAVTLLMDGIEVGSYSAGITHATLNVSKLGLDRSFPHRLSIVSSSARSRYPLSFDFADEAIPLPLANMVPASATAIIWLPDWSITYRDMY